MQRKRLLLRATAVASSVTLMAAFVAYRAGALDSLLPGQSGARQREMISGSKSQIHIVTPHNASEDARLLGSKSDVLVGPSSTSELSIPSDPAKIVDQPSQVLMYSSKSGAVVPEHFSLATAEAIAEAVTNPQRHGSDKPPVMMHGSKSFVIVDPRVTQNNEAQSEAAGNILPDNTVLMSGSKSITVVPPSGSPAKSKSQP